MSSDTKESSYSVPFIMPCFYFEDMDSDPNIVVKLYNHIKEEYDNFRNYVNDDGTVFKRNEKKHSSIEDNFSYFGFFIIFYFCLKKSYKISSNKDIKIFFENEINKINNDALGFPIKIIKKEINKLLENNNLENSYDINDIRFSMENNEEDKYEDMYCYYQDYMNYVCPSKLRSAANKNIERKVIKIKRIFFVSSPSFYKGFLLHEKVGISPKDIQYFHIDNELKFDNYSHKGCNCNTEDCNKMICFFQKY